MGVLLAIYTQNTRGTADLRRGECPVSGGTRPGSLGHVSIYGTPDGAGWHHPRIVGPSSRSGASPVRGYGAAGGAPGIWSEERTLQWSVHPRSGMMKTDLTLADRLRQAAWRLVSG